MSWRLRSQRANVLSFPVRFQGRVDTLREARFESVDVLLQLAGVVSGGEDLQFAGIVA
jgi:hypothetical protein